MSSIKYTLTVFLGLCTSFLFAQEDLLSLLGDEETPDTVVNYARAAFKTNRVINLHSLESTSGGVLESANCLD